MIKRENPDDYVISHSRCPRCAEISPLKANVVKYVLTSDRDNVVVNCGRCKWNGVWRDLIPLDGEHQPMTVLEKLALRERQIRTTLVSYRKRFNGVYPVGSCIDHAGFVESLESELESIQTTIPVALKDDLRSTNN